MTARQAAAWQSCGVPIAKCLRNMCRAAWPPRCIFCGFDVAVECTAICESCYIELPWRMNIAEPLPRHFEQVVVPLQYAFPIDVAVKTFKFKRKLFYAPAFSQILLDSLPSLSSDIDAVAPVPLHWRRKMVRGFNQVDELAKPVAKVLGVPLLRTLRRRTATQYQSGLSAAMRRKNVSRSFRSTRPILAQHVLIVDDVITTGATVRALASTLRRAGVSKMSVLALAR